MSRQAKACKKDESAIDEWLFGEAPPTFRQAQKLANQLHVPFGYLFFTEPPEERLPAQITRTDPQIAETQDRLLSARQ